MSEDAEREDLIRRFRADRWLAHKVLFEHRHSVAPALFHEEMVNGFWGDARRSGVFAFRGGAKSTIAEEAVALGVGELSFRNCVFVGASEGRAAERIAAVKRELERNELLIWLYGEQKGADAWTQTKLVTKNQVCIQALGKDQDIRGLKFLDWRPDWLVIDDFEDKDNVSTPEGRRKTFVWFLADLLPACAPSCRVRVLATPMDAESVPIRLRSEMGWPWRSFPVLRFGDDGSEEATWPALYPLSWIAEERAGYQRTGQIAVWDREFMCEAVSAQDQVFRPEDIRVEPRIRTWEPVWAMVDPARTTHRQTSAMTGIVVFSWIGNDLVVWEDRTGFLKPDEIVRHIFEIDEKYSPVLIGVEEDGLNEWLMQPIRQESAKRGAFVPVQPMRAPRGKLDFISGLQPFGKAGELIFAHEMPELRGQFLGFPRGRIDGPNALAYALTLRPGLPVYDAFNPRVHVADRLIWPAGEPLWLAMNATGAVTTAVLMGAAYGRISILRDWIREGDPGANAADLVREASLESRMRLRIAAGPGHFDQWHNVGLVQALRAIPLEVSAGAAPGKGRDYMRGLLGRVAAGTVPNYRVAVDARFSLAALAAGYARKPGKPEPEPGIHRTLMEGVESVAGLLALGALDENVDWAYTARGQRYRRYQTGHEARH